MSNPFESLDEEREALDNCRAVVSQWGEDGRAELEDSSVFVESLSIPREGLSPFQEHLSACDADRSVLRECVPRIAIDPLALRRDPLRVRRGALGPPTGPAPTTETPSRHGDTFCPQVDRHSRCAVRSAWHNESASRSSDRSSTSSWRTSTIAETPDRALGEGLCEHGAVRSPRREALSARREVLGEGRAVLSLCRDGPSHFADVFSSRGDVISQGCPVAGSH
jgi:hypothetical protein